MRSLRFAFLLLLVGCAELQTILTPPTTTPAPVSAAPTTGQPVAVYQKVSFADMPGWTGDKIEEALPALTLSCKRLVTLPAERSLGANNKTGTVSDWTDFCTRLLMVSTPAELRAVIEEKLQPWQITEAGKSDGLFTGYYEASLKGSRSRHGTYQTPLLRRPADLVMVDLGDFREELKGQRIAGRVQGGRLKPYEDRRQIETGALSSRHLEMVWIDDPVAAFFVQVQGSGRVQLDDGDVLRVGYDGQNGHPYVAIGRTLVAEGALTQEQVSMQSIAAWLHAHPDRAAAVMHSNPSYVFFRAVPGIDGPEGAAHVALTPGRSLAVDNRFIGYHVPVWLDAEDPRSAGARLQRLMVAQDTGGAINGVVRGDFFWGHGAEAEAAAGVMKSQGRYFVLLPKALNPAGSAP